MSEQAKQSPTGEPKPWPTGEPDDTEPSAERQTELRSAYEANIKLGKPPYAGVVITTRGEVNWIVRERGWRSEGLETLEQRIDFRRAAFIGANLQDAPLNFADFIEAVINNSSITRAQLGFANLSGALIGMSDLTHAELGRANLSGATMVGCDCTSADFSGANLSGVFAGDGNFTGADLRGASLTGTMLAGKLAQANLSQARMDSATILGSPETLTTLGDVVEMDAATRLLDVAWNGAILSNVDWQHLDRLGDEADIKAADSRVERVRALRNSARANRGLAKALQAQGLTIPALKFRMREQRFERKALFWDRKPGQWFFSWLLNIVSGYGDRPGRGLLVYLAVIVWFANFYVWAAHGLITFGLAPSEITSLPWYQALVLSASSFHGRGFFQPLHSLGDPVAILAAFEAVIGLFIEITFIATFTQRFFAR